MQALPRQASAVMDVSSPALLAILNALPTPLIVVDREFCVRFVNFESQQFFDSGRSAMVDHPLSDLVPADSPLFTLLHQALHQNSSHADHAIWLETPRIGRRLVSATAGPMGDPPAQAVLTLHEASTARRIDNQLTHRGAARSVTAMASMLAHEVKNPLSGIRGAAQLLELNASDDDRQLTRLIIDETDRIVGLVERMEVFSDDRPLEREAVNIHVVLEHVRRLAHSGFARHVRFTERYDPSLPPAYGNRDQLVQVFLNLIKNAAEAAPRDNAEIVLSTRYQRGVSIAVPSTSRRQSLPLAVTVQDNGPGVPEDVQDHLFDPFITTKINGTGLGLALVAKIVGDHGGVIGFETEPRRTVFKVSLPIVTAPSDMAVRDTVLEAP